MGGTVKLAALNNRYDWRIAALQTRMPREKPMRKALITGITGQDGSYLAELLLNHGYHVMGVVRRQPNSTSGRSDTSRVPKAVDIVESNLLEDRSVESLLLRFHPNEVYNLAARASSSTLWTEPVS